MGIHFRIGLALLGLVMVLDGTGRMAPADAPATMVPILAVALWYSARLAEALGVAEVLGGAALVWYEAVQFLAGGTPLTPHRVAHR